MRTLVAYYFTIIKTAFTHSVGLSDLYSGVVGAVIGVIVHFWPTLKPIWETLLWQVPAWIFVVTILCRFLLSPYWINTKQEAQVRALEQKLKIRIKAFLEEKSISPESTPTNLIQRDPFGNIIKIEPGTAAKWFQFSVTPAGTEPLRGCEAILTSVRRIVDDYKLGDNLVEEHIPLMWSQSDDLTKVEIRERYIRRANLFALYNSNPPSIDPQTKPLKIILKDGINNPGSYQVECLVTADEAPSVPMKFKFSWEDFNNASLAEIK